MDEEEEVTMVFLTKAEVLPTATALLTYLSSESATSYCTEISEDVIGGRGTLGQNTGEPVVWGRGGVVLPQELVGRRWWFMEQTGQGAQAVLLDLTGEFAKIECTGWSGYADLNQVIADLAKEEDPANVVDTLATMEMIF